MNNESLPLYVIILLDLYHCTSDVVLTWNGNKVGGNRLGKSNPYVVTISGVERNKYYQSYHFLKISDWFTNDDKCFTYDLYLIYKNVVSQKFIPLFYFIYIFFCLFVHGSLTRAKNVKADVLPRLLEVQQDTLLNTKIYSTEKNC